MREKLYWVAAGVLLYLFVNAAVWFLERFAYPFP